MLKKASIVTLGLAVAVSPGAAFAAEPSSENTVQVEDQNLFQEETNNNEIDVSLEPSEESTTNQEDLDEGAEGEPTEDLVDGEEEELPVVEENDGDATTEDGQVEDEETVVEEDQLEENENSPIDKEETSEEDNSEDENGNNDEIDDPTLTDLEIIEEMEGSISGKVSAYDSEKRYYTLSVDVNITNNSTEDIQDIYAGLDIPDDIMVLATDETPVGIEILEEEGKGNILAISLDKINAGEKKRVTLSIPVLGKTTGEGLNSTINIYRSGTYESLGQITGTSNVNYGLMNQAMYFDGKAQAVTDFPGLPDNQFGMQFGFRLQNLTLEDVDRVNIEFIVPNGVKIHEPDSYQEGDTPDALDDFLGDGSGLGLGSTKLNLDWNGNNATVDIGAVESGTMFQGFFSAIGESDLSFNEIKGLKVKITLNKGDDVVEEITTPIELVKYEGNDNDDNNETPSGSDEQLDSDKTPTPTPVTDNNQVNDANNDVNDNGDQNDEKITVIPVNDKNDSDEAQGGKLPKTAGTNPAGALMGGAIAAFGAAILAVRKKIFINK